MVAATKCYLGSTTGINWSCRGAIITTVISIKITAGDTQVPHHTFHSAVLPFQQLRIQTFWWKLFCEVKLIALICLSVLSVKTSNGRKICLFVFLIIFSVLLYLDMCVKTHSSGKQTPVMSQALRATPAIRAVVHFQPCGWSSSFSWKL